MELLRKPNPLNITGQILNEIVLKYISLEFERIILERFLLSLVEYHFHHVR